jgi:hypothetical protein
VHFVPGLLTGGLVLLTDSFPSEELNEINYYTSQYSWAFIYKNSMEV